MSSATDKYLTFRGDTKAVVGAGATVAFVTVHPEGHPTAIYRLDADKFALAADPLPAGGVDLVADGETLWVAGSDRRVYRCPLAGGKAAAMGPALDAPPVALALLADARLAVLAGSVVAVLARKDGKLLQTLELPEPGASLAADPTGRWVLAGTTRGTVCVFDCEEKEQFLLGESAKLHEGAVTALLFEPDELRFLSAGADGRLLSTHARGKLEPEDKGRGNNHSDAVTALMWGLADRLLSGSRDGTVKNWPRVGATKPATVRDAGKVVGLALVQVHTRTYLVAAGEDNVLRLFPIDLAGKVGDVSHRVYGAAAWAKSELTHAEPRRRESALRQLAEWNDTPAVESIAAQLHDADHGLRLLAAELLTASTHPRAAKLLEKGLTHADEAVRVAAFNGLRKHLGPQDLRPLDLALAANKPDVGRLAVQALETLAAKDDQALARLTQALDAPTPEVRQAALAGLEKVNDPKSPEASLLALGSRHGDLRRLALVRLLQRGMLQDGRVASALRRAAEDKDAEVRRAAFLLSLHTRPALLASLRSRDPELERQLTELEGTAPAETKPTKAARSKGAGPSELDADDVQPLLQATASRALDTCLRGARGLAVLGDERALGLLLQLSREQDATARAEVARALAALDDPRSVGRLRSLLFDADAAVRDAAFTALERLHEADPLVAAEAGLSASFEDVRRRGLQAVIAAARKKLPQSAADPAWPLLIRAMNDDAPAVRSEAFKAALNLQIGGGGANTLRFVLQSVHADVRREVLTEVMARPAEPWAWALLLEFYNDPDPALRGEAFDFATAKQKKELEPLQTALRSRHADVRRRAVDALVKRHTKAAQSLLATALADDDAKVRQAALDSLIGDDVTEALRGALDSPHLDVHARAAKALARHGDVTALKSLAALAAAPEPKNEGPERLAAWSALVETALDGLAELGNPDALPHVLPHLNSPHANLRKAAGWALAWTAVGEHPGALRQAMQHADPQVKYHAAFGLALGGEASAAPLVFSPEGGKVLPAKERMAAAVALGPAGEDQLVAVLDHADERARTHALLLLMLLELKLGGEVPSRCLAALASREPRVRLRAARGLDNYRDPGLFLQYVARLFADRGGAEPEGGAAEKKPWDIAAGVVDAVATLLAHGSPQAKARTARLLSRLFKEAQAAWDRAWAVHEKRFSGEIAALRKQAPAAKAPATKTDPAQLEELAFGAYVGLVREQGGTYAAKDRAGAEPHVVRVRQTALSWVLEMARRDPTRFGLPAQAVCVQALGDPNQAVRVQAFEQLRQLGMDATALGAEALETGHTDLGVRGLELLSGGTAEAKASAKGQAVLEQAMLTRKDDLAIEAAKLLTPHRGAAAVASAALSAAHEPLRQQAVAWLAAEYEKSKDAPKQLRAALESRYAKVREAAALELATKKDPAAFDALVRFLADAADEARQRIFVDALQRLGDPRTPLALLDRLENDPAKTASAGLLLSAAASFRQTGPVVDRLLRMMDSNPAWRLPAGNALLTISGHQQPIEDPEDERPDDREWERRQFPRHDAVLAALMDKSLALNAVERLNKTLPAARWARGKEVDPVLARLCAHPDERLRRGAVEALGWRLRKRGSPPDALLQALSHRDPTTQFLAAEGLARAGRGEGLSVLLSAVDFLPDLDLRRRAVRALGELGDARALDPLLKLANEAGHALQAEAAEAIGHLGRSGAAEEIFKLLERFAKGDGGVADNALRGLRWLNTHAAWQLIRKRAADETVIFRDTAVELLGYNDDPATRDLLLRLLSGDVDSDAVDQALASARRLFGPDALEPDYALLRRQYVDTDEEAERQALRRVSERGEPGRVFDLVATARDGDVKGALSVNLLNRTPLPVKEAEAALAGNDPWTVRLAARVLGRGGAAGGGTSKNAVAALRDALRKWRATWDERRRLERRRGGSAWGEDDELAETLTPVLEALLWAAGRLGAAQDELVAAASANPDDRDYRTVRRAAVAALADGAKPDGATLDALESAAASADDPQTRALAADALARHDPKRAAQLAGRIMPDRVALGRVAGNLRESDAVGKSLRSAVLQQHYQGVALPHLVGRGDVEGLSAAAQDPKLPRETRLGAIEGLGKLAAEPAEAYLRAVGATDKEDEELRKAAWRALRRSKRAREKAASSPAVAGAEVKR